MKTFDEEFQEFINKWCGSSSAHLSDTDENDGQSLRDFVARNYILKQKVREAIENADIRADTDLEREAVKLKLLKELGL